MQTIFQLAPQSRVQTPKGCATAIGVYHENIWFHIDGDAGATYWDNIRSYSDLLANGFELLGVNEYYVCNFVLTKKSNCRHSISEAKI